MPRIWICPKHGPVCEEKKTTEATETIRLHREIMKCHEILMLQTDHREEDALTRIRTVYEIAKNHPDDFLEAVKALITGMEL